MRERNINGVRAEQNQGAAESRMRVIGTAIATATLQVSVTRNSTQILRSKGSREINVGHLRRTRFT